MDSKIKELPPLDTMDLGAKVDAVHDAILGMKPILERVEVTGNELSQRLRFVENSTIRHEERIVVLEKKKDRGLHIGVLLRNLSEAYDEYHAVVTLFSLGLTLATILLHFHATAVSSKTIQLLKATVQQEGDK